MAQTQQVKGRATSIFQHDGCTVVQYRGTLVVSFDDDTIELDSGGWRTVTTKLRMNQASNQYDLGYQVFQKDFEWFVTLPDGTTVDFYNGITFSR